MPKSHYRSSYKCPKSKASRGCEGPHAMLNSKNDQKRTKVGSSSGSSAERGVPGGVPARVLAQKGGSSKVPAEGSSTQRGSSKGFQQGFQHLCFTFVPLHFSPHAFVGPLGRLGQGCPGCRGHWGLWWPRWVGQHQPRRPPRHQGGDPLGHHHCPHPLHAPPPRRRQAALPPHQMAGGGLGGQPRCADPAGPAACRQPG